MMATAEKRKRCENYSTADLHLLVEVIEPHINVVETKKMDNNSYQRKINVWDTVVSNFNSSSSSHSWSKESLQNCWKRLKQVRVLL